MGNYKFKEKDGVISVLDGDNVVAKYEVDKHWIEKNISQKDSETLNVRLYNRIKGFLDCEIKIGIEKVQKVPN